MDGTNSNAEAGPSRSRPPAILPVAIPVPDPQPLPPSRPIPDIPPATPPSTAKSKRRSWFGFGSASGSPSVITTPTPASVSTKKGRRRSSVSIYNAEAGGVDLDLAPVISEGKDKKTLISLNKGKEGEIEEEEALTIDGDPEKTVKKKKRGSKDIKENETYEVLRMQDLSGRSKETTRSTSDQTVKVSSDGPDIFQPQPFTSRIRNFSRTASDRDPFITPTSIPTATLKSSSSSMTSNPQATAKPRTSSSSSSHRQTSLQIDKTQPPIPVDVDRPLPPLPPKTSSLKAKQSMPEMPKGIIVTPSSPRKLSKTPRKPPLTQRRSRSATGQSRESKQEKRSQSTNPSPTIGLGLPSALLPSTKGDTDSPPPPPVPSKPQSVSSPFPSRSPSPIPKIAFVEPDDVHPKTDHAPQEEKRKVVRRARSLSGFFGKSPPAVPTPKLEEPPHFQEEKDSPMAESVGKSGGGVLEWLGVRKTSKRKISEPRILDQPEGVSPLTVQNEFQDDQVENEKNRESLEPPQHSGLPPSGSPRQSPRQPKYNSAASTATLVPQSGQSKISGIFTRRSSARTTDDESEPPSVKVVPMAIPNASMRNHTALSSQSSFSSPAHDPISPFIPDSGPWVSTPQSEKEETLFSPPEGSNWGPGRRPWMEGGERNNSSRSSVSSPLDSLPEQGLPPIEEPLKPPPSMREGRVRSWSDAPLPPQRLTAQSSNPHLPIPRPATPNGQSMSLSSSPQTPSRPKLGDRANSSNSAIIGRMKSVFSKSTNRSRSNSLLRQGSNDIDEFGTMPGFSADSRSQTMRPSTSSSSMASSGPYRGKSIGEENIRSIPQRPGSSSALDIERMQDQDKSRSPKTSFTPSMPSLDTRPQVLQESTMARKNRVRASTISMAPTSYNFLPPPSPNLFPITATPPRRRPGTIHRISNGLFGSSINTTSGPSSPRSSSLFPLPARSSGSISSSATNQGGAVQWEDGSNGFLSPGTSPRPSTGSISAVMTNSMIKQAAMREGDESPNEWLDRVVATVGRDDIANVLASSGDGFYTEALQIYMSTFDFTHNALDVALRRLLMHMSLPKETQQIDRVIEAFSRRYEECEPGLFGQKDNTYVLAFSMMMLHTDAFNKSNKNKMTKVDYVRNTRMEGVAPIALETFFDNITFTPFVFIEDDTDLKESSGYESSSSTFGPSTPTFSGPGSLNAATLMSNGKTKIDVYHMIVRGLLGSLRVDIEHQIPSENPFSYMGSRPLMDLDQLCRSFAEANSLIIPSFIGSDHRRRTPGKLTTPARRYTVGAKDEKLEDLVLRVVKVGLVSRKDDTDPTSKKTSRKWKSWSVILTSSQLLFFKDPTWALTLLEQARSAQTKDKAGHILLPRQTTFKPDEVFSLKDCVAVFDRTFTAYSNTFRFVMPQSRQYLLQSTDEFEMNEWVSLINYASAFKTVNMKMKGPAMRKDQVVLAGAAAAASHKRELRSENNQSSMNGSGSGSAKKAVFGDSNGNSNGLGLGLSDISMETEDVKVKSKNGKVDVDVEEEGNEVVNEGEQLEEVFGVVKAELKAGRGQAGTNRSDIPVAEDSETSHEKELDHDQRKPIHTSRVSVIYEHLNVFREKCKPLEASLKTSLLLVRNIALLTPFQKSTRDRLSMSIPPLAHKIRSDRVALTKLRLWIKIMEHEGEREDREWKVVRHVALQAAARSLREDGIEGVVKDVNRTSLDQADIPKLALPIPNSELESDGPSQHQYQIQRHNMNSPVELPEIIRRSSDEPPPSDRNENRNADGNGGRSNSIDQVNESPSDIRNEGRGYKKGSGGTLKRRSNSASDLLSPHSNLRRSSEVADPATSSPITTSKITRDSPSNKSTSGTDTPMMIFTMESPVQVPSADNTHTITIVQDENGNEMSNQQSEDLTTTNINDNFNEKEEKEEKDEAEEQHSTRSR
ncbi:uncharacterized protein IL334_007697 [Kwoniella shivajii]|uniref:SEC7 domain-containing protein n=1 Tax=Kwoniella shivajii TaxID=564305 RepID=A0ABZ1DBM3_9TREE|nr:hypothetical protein IL334_007697 [Kwoniella shivajii]